MAAETIEYCTICGASHRSGDLPVLCYNIRLLTVCIRDYLDDSKDETESAECLISACDEVLGEEPEDDDSEVFEDENN